MKSSRPLKILSIDWDYFVKATFMQRTLKFPDGGNENLPSELSDTIWAERCACSPDILDIKVDEYALNKLKDFIQHNIDRLTFVTVWDSHKYLYDEVMSRIIPEQPLEVINIDFHHDLYNYGEDVNCGNWANHLFEDKSNRKSVDKDKYIWIAKKDSDMDVLSHENLEIKLIDDLDKINDFTADLVYLCRSSIWSPPHLDESFNNLIMWLQQYFSYVEVNISGSRYTSKFKNNIEIYSDVLKQMRRSVEN